jgi:predicted O-methyltransferase YrrM
MGRNGTGIARLKPVNPVGKNSGRAGLWTNTQAFAEELVIESEGGRAARKRAHELGLDAISTGVASTLTTLARAVGAKAVVEIGTGTAVSASALLAGMAADAVLTSIDAEAENQLVAREVLTADGVPLRRVRMISGQPLVVLPKLSDGAYDLVFIDGDPLEFVEYVAQAERLLRSGGVLAMHHALWGGLVADERNEDDEPLIIREALTAVLEGDAFVASLLPIGDGLLIAVRN